MIDAKWVLFLDNSFRQQFYSKYVYEFLCSNRFVFYCLKNDEQRIKGVLLYRDATVPIRVDSDSRIGRNRLELESESKSVRIGMEFA